MRLSLRPFLILASLVCCQVASAQIERTHASVSHLDFYVTNTGPIFNNAQAAGLLYPKGDPNPTKYIFGGGLWIGMRKLLPANSPEIEWSEAGSPNESITSLLPDPGANNLLAYGVNGDLFRRSKSEDRWTLLGRVGNGRNAVLLPSGEIMAMSPTQILVGPQAGPWLPTNINNVVAVTQNGFILTSNATIYGPNSDFTSWSVVRAIGHVTSAVGSSCGTSAAFASARSIWFTTNGGGSWDSVANPGTSASGIAMMQDGSILVSVPMAGVLRSVDRGVTWQPFNTGLLETGVKMLTTSDGVHAAVVTDSNIYDLQAGSWHPHAAHVDWLHFVHSLAIDATGSIHVGLVDGTVYTQWQSEKLAPGVRSLVELGWNPNSGAGWYVPGESVLPADGADSIAKYHTYYSTQFDKQNGDPLLSNQSTAPNKWPVWNTARDTVGHNFNFGSRVSNVMTRTSLAATEKPVMFSQEDILNTYSDRTTTNNPEFKPGAGFPFGVTVEESIYSWGFGSYRDLVFVRYRVVNSSLDTMKDVYLAPNFDGDVGDPSNDMSSAITDSTSVEHALSGDPDFVDYMQHPSKLGMGYQSSQPENGQEMGMVGFATVESPIVTPDGRVIDPSDSAKLGGYGPRSLYRTNALGLTTFKQWTITNDPSGPAPRYAFVSSHDHDANSTTKGDMRSMMATGPFNLAPGEAAATTIAVGVVHPSTTSRSTNFDSLVHLMANAHRFFAHAVQNSSDPNDVSIVNFDGVQPTESGVGRTTLGCSLSIELAPNPASQQLAIEFTLPKAESVSIAIFDITGKPVRSIAASSGYPKGDSRVACSVAGLAAGSYVVRLSAGQEQIERKLSIEN